MFLLRFGVATFRLQNAALSVVLAPVLLTAAGVVTVLDYILATTISTGEHDEFSYHALTVPYITST